MNEDVEGHILSAAPPHGVRILIVEDDALFLKVYDEKLAILSRAFPDAVILKVGRLDEAMDVINRSPPPDVVILDLGLEDATWQEVSARADEIAQRSAVLVISAHTEDEIRQRITSPGIRIMSKSPYLWQQTDIVEVVVGLVCERRKISFEPVWERLNRVRDRLNEVQEKLDAPHQGR